CSLVSSLLLNGATMSQESSLTQSAHSVRQVLTAYRFDRRFARIHDDCADCFGRRALRSVKQMRITCGRLWLAVTQHFADQHQRSPGARERTGEAVTQIVNAQVLNACGFCNPPPGVPDVH